MSAYTLNVKSAFYFVNNNSCDSHVGRIFINLY